MNCLELNELEVGDINRLTSELRNMYLHAANEEFVKRAVYYSSLLPSRILEVCHHFKRSDEHSGLLKIVGLPDDKPGSTPESWNYRGSFTPGLNVDFVAVLFSSLVGFVFGWSTQQKGKLIHDLIPIKDKGSAQTGYGSTSELVMHTEDSFHPFRGDYICMYGIRNLQNVPTTFASIRDVELDDNTRDVLFQKRYQIQPDESHVEQQQRVDNDSAQFIDKLHGEPDKTSILYGKRETPYICFDPFYTLVDETDKASVEALNALERELIKHTCEIVLGPGDICLVDNRKVVHGRKPFQPNFDGQDRWLKRINISGNLRKSVSKRQCIDSRIIGN